MQTTLSHHPLPNNLWHRWRWLLWLVLVAIVYGWAVGGLHFTGIQESAGSVSRSILAGLAHPDWAYVYNGSGEDLVSLIIQRPSCRLSSACRLPSGPPEPSTNGPTYAPGVVRSF